MHSLGQFDQLTGCGGVLQLAAGRSIPKCLGQGYVLISSSWCGLVVPDVGQRPGIRAVHSASWAASAGLLVHIVEGDVSVFCLEADYCTVCCAGSRCATLLHRGTLW